MAASFVYYKFKYIQLKTSTYIYMASVCTVIYQSVCLSGLYVCEHIWLPGDVHKTIYILPCSYNYMHVTIYYSKMPLENLKWALIYLPET